MATGSFKVSRTPSWYTQLAKNISLKNGSIKAIWSTQLDKPCPPLPFLFKEVSSPPKWFLFQKNNNIILGKKQKRILYKETLFKHYRINSGTPSIFSCR